MTQEQFEKASLNQAMQKQVGFIADNILLPFKAQTLKVDGRDTDFNWALSQFGDIIELFVKEVEQRRIDLIAKLEKDMEAI